MGNVKHPRIDHLYQLQLSGKGKPERCGTKLLVTMDSQYGMVY
jgi:hypothetical protein